MRLYLKGHDYKYACEQMLLTLFPSERPEYPDGKAAGERMEISLSKKERRCTASCILCLAGKKYYGRAFADIALLEGELITDRICQRLIKNAIYRAALSSGISRPAWGALTGVRPGKILASLIKSGLSEDEALRKFISDYDVTPRRAALCMDTTKQTLMAERSLGEKDICLYVGIPFCPTRCAYCSFVSQSVEKSMKLIPPFVDALMLEIEATAAVINKLGKNIISIYMGGGTPTTLSAPQLERLCTKLEKCFNLENVREYTVEAGRPDTISEDKLQVLKAHGVSRVSVNPQTMSDAVLEAIGRRHTAQDIIDALEKVRSVGGMEVNMDLIAGLTSDSVSGFEDTLEKVLALNPENITVHTLALKKGSRITLEGSSLPSDAEVGKMLDIADNKLRAAGYEPYYLYRQKFMSGGFENVGWAKNGTVNVYNVCIMEELCSNIALGGGGSTKLVAPGVGKNIRIFDPKYPNEYINGIEKICRDKQGIAEFFSKEND